MRPSSRPGQRQVRRPVRRADVECRRDVPGRRERRFGLQQHVHAHVLDSLEAADRAAELVARPGVVDCHPHGVQGPAGLFGDQRDPGVVEGRVQRGTRRADQSGRCLRQGDPAEPAGLVDPCQRPDRQSGSAPGDGEKH